MNAVDIVPPPLQAALDDARFDRLGEISRLAGSLWLQLGDAAHQADPHVVRVKLAQICSVTIAAHEVESTFGQDWEADLER
jgi:hypothetical protein